MPADLDASEGVRSEERHTRTAVRIGSGTLVQVRGSRASGVAHSYKCADPGCREWRGRTTVPILGVESGALVQLPMKVSPLLELSPGNGLKAIANFTRIRSPMPSEHRSRVDRDD